MRLGREEEKKAWRERGRESFHESKLAETDRVVAVHPTQVSNSIFVQPGPARLLDGVWILGAGCGRVARSEVAAPRIRAGEPRACESIPGPGLLLPALLVTPFTFSTAVERRWHMDSSQGQNQDGTYTTVKAVF